MKVKEFLVSDDAAGMRLSDYIRIILPDLRESEIRKLFSLRDIKLDSRPAPSAAVLRPGQLLRIYLPDRPAATLHIVYEDERVLLLNKPSGISVEPDGSGGITLSELCRVYAEEHGFSSPAPCHRLDNKTSGLCLFAKDTEALNILQDAFRSRHVDKYYICLVRGIMKPPAAVCTAYLRKDAAAGKVYVSDHAVPGSRPIVTGYETLTSGPVSRLKIHLLTGRTHQIRAHLSALGHPVLGDDLYGDRAFNHARKTRGLKLCAVSLTLHTDGRLPALDDREFSIEPPF